jgi:hypothetical protein
MKDIVQWTAPSPLWAGISGSGEAVVREAMLQPAILRFAADSFMEDFMNMMVNDPARLGNFLALPETWRGPLPQVAPVEAVAPFLLKNGRSRFLPTRTKQELMRLSALPLETSLQGQSTSGETGAETSPQILKLYQPAHQRFYMVAGCLVCRQAGLPDHAVASNRQERVTFVVRRLRERSNGGQTQAASLTLPNTSKVYDEYAFVTTPGNKGWQKIEGVGEQLIKDEEQLPLSPNNFTDTDERQRRLFAGLIPVAKREAYMGAALSTAPGKNGNTGASTNVLPKTARKFLFRTQVSEPWKRIIDRAVSMQKALGGSPAPSVAEAAVQLKEAREQLQVSSWYVLLDLAKFLNEHVNDVWKVIVNPALESTLTSTAQKNLLAALKNTGAGSLLVDALRSVAPDPIIYTAESVKPNLLAALRAIKNPQDDWEERLDQVKTAYSRKDASLAAAWPPFLFPLADPVEAAPQVPNSVPPLDSNDQVEADATINQGVSDAAAYAAIDRLTALVVRAMPANSSKLVPEPPLASQQLMERGEGLFVIRFVYERPLCGPLEPPEVSKPTTEFQMAGFFDPDAPARPIRIALPLDTSPAGLRKFDKNTAFAISDVLCGQMQRLRSMTFGDLVLSVLPWPFHKSLSAAAPDAGACKGGNGLEIGMICSISIPIITICALLLLMIIVSLLDIVFRWMPYFFICFPVPGLKAKK